MQSIYLFRETFYHTSSLSSVEFRGNYILTAMLSYCNISSSFGTRLLALYYTAGRCFLLHDSGCRSYEMSVRS